MRQWSGPLALALVFLVAPLCPAQTAMAPVEPDSMAGQRLRPGDIVQLKIWREPDMSGQYPVDEDGMVVFPLLGPREVVDESPESLKRQLVEDYSVYFKHLSIDVTLLRRVNVLGSVNKPGLYPVDPTMTVADALALAGGATPQGKPDEVELIRDGETLITEIGKQTPIADLPIRSGDQLFVPERSWFSRYSGIVATALSSAISLFIAWKF